jgi:hypothetical protein
VTWPKYGDNIWLLWTTGDLFESASYKTILRRFTPAEDTAHVILKDYYGAGEIIGWLKYKFCLMEILFSKYWLPPFAGSITESAFRYNTTTWEKEGEIQVFDNIIFDGYYFNSGGIVCDSSGNIATTWNQVTYKDEFNNNTCQYYAKRIKSDGLKIEEVDTLCELMDGGAYYPVATTKPSISSTPSGIYQIVFPYRNLYTTVGEPRFMIMSYRSKIYDPTSILDNPKPEIIVNINPDLANHNYSIELACKDLASTPSASIFNLKGQLVNKLTFTQAEHAYQANWQTKDVNSGIYFLKWNWDGQAGERKLVVVK